MEKRLPKGYIYREDRQCYQYRFTYRSKQYYIYGKTIDECEEKKIEKIELLKSGLDVDTQDFTLKKYYQIWLEEQKKVTKASSIYTTEKYWKYIDGVLGNKKVVDIQKQDIILMQQELLKNYSEDTVNRAHKLLVQILNSAISDRIINFNYANTVRRVKTKRLPARETNHRALTQEEQEQFFKYAAGNHYCPLFSFLVQTGVRVGEALALTWRDVDVKKQEISINKTVMRSGDTQYEISETPKTSSSNRKIPITPAVAQILQRQKMIEVSAGKISPHELIFTGVNGKMSNYNNVNSAITRVISKMRADGIEIDHFSVHAFRDTFATRCIEQGMQPIILKELLGHSSLKMTMDVYAHVLPETKMKELSKIDIAI